MSFFGSRYMLVNDHQFGSSDYSGYVISVNLYGNYTSSDAAVYNVGVRPKLEN